MSRKQNVEAAHEAGKREWPAPWIVSRHCYREEEARAWIAGLRESCPDEYAGRLPAQ